MAPENLKKGLIFGICAAFVVGLQPVIANARPSEIDFYIFAAMTNLVEFLIFFPLFLLERRHLKKDLARNITMEERDICDSKLHGWKKNIKIIILIGLIFTAVPVFNFFGLEYAGAINGSLVLKTRILFSLLFGYLILHEKVTPLQIVFSFVLFFGVTLAITQGEFFILEFNIGVIILLINVIISPFGHNLTKSRLNRNEVTPYLVIIVRNLCSIIILFSTYFLIFPLENIGIFLNPINYFWFILMGCTYGFGLLLWYRTMSYLDMSKAMTLLSFTTIVTAIFATIFLDEVFTLFHLTGTFIMIISTIIIVKPKKPDVEAL